MEQTYHILRSCIDPIFIIFVFLLISFLICLISGKIKGGVLFLFLTIVLLYGFSIEPTSNYLSYGLEKDYIKNRSVGEKMKLDVIVALSGGSYYIRALDKTFPARPPWLD